MLNSKVPYISIVIPSYNSGNTIRNTIKGIGNQKNVTKILEVIIVDSSDDGTTKKILEGIKWPNVKIISQGIKIMPAIQRNIGAETAKGKLLVFIDSDAFPDINWLYKIEEAYSNGFIVGGGSYLIDKDQISIKSIIAQYYLEFGEFIPAGKPRLKKMVPAANFFCEKKFFHENKGFPLIRASEDSLFCMNVNKRSPLYFFPQAIVYHTFRTNLKDSLKNQKLLGKYIIIYRKLFYPYYFKHTNCILFLFPLIVLYKFSKTYFSPLFRKGNHFLKLNKSLYQFILCIAWWSSGVWQGIFERE